MKKKIPKILGLTFALVLALSLLTPLAAVAGTNKWSAETIMSYSDSVDPTKTISPNDVVALATDSAGDALYAIVAGAAGVSFQECGKGVVEWSTEQPRSGSYSVRLELPAPIDNLDEARVVFDYDGTLGSLVSMSFHAYLQESFPSYGAWETPYITMSIDRDDDGEADAWLVHEPRTSIATLGTWERIDFGADSGVAVAHSITGGPYDEWLSWPSMPLSQLKGEAAGVVEYPEKTWGECTVTQVKVGVGNVGVGSFDDPVIAFVDDITINGVTYDLEPVCVYKSINGGQTWSKMTKGPSTAVALAVAPDDPDYVVAADAARKVWVSINGGSTWSSTDMDDFKGGAILCVDISVPDDDGKRWVAAGGYGTGGAVLMVVQIETFAAATPATLAVGTERVLAVKFSPMLDYDDTILALTIDGSKTDLQMCDKLGASTPTWNDEAGYPVEDIIGVEASVASIALPDTYDGVEPTARVAYIGTDKGACRLDDDVVTPLLTEGKDFRSVAYNSVDNMLLIGPGESTAVRMSANPDIASPSFTTPLRYKYPSGEKVTAVAWLGSTMLCGTRGAESALSVSTDARSWNQISLIDTDLGRITDVAVSDDGDTIYLASLKGNNASIWLYASRWERVFCDAIGDAGDVIVRFVPGDPEHVLVAEVGGKEIRVSTNSGETWKKAKSKVDIVDIAVKDEDIVHVLGDTKVSTSTNGGRRFGVSPVTIATGFDATDGNIVVAPNGDVLVAGTYGGVVTAAYSDDDAAHFTKTAETTGITPEAYKPILIAPDKDYATNSVIFVACEEDATADNKIMRWEIGAGAEEWKSKGPKADLPAGSWFTGLGYYGGALYATATSDINSAHAYSLDPGAKAPIWSIADADGVDFGCAPQALRFSSGSTKLWAVDIAGDPDKLYSYTDTISLAIAAPTLAAPASGYVGTVDVVLGRINPVRFSWEQVHKDAKYQLEIATDAAMKLNKQAYKLLTKDEYFTISEGGNPEANEYPFIAGETYYWRVKVYDPVSGPWSEVRSFSIEEAVAAPVEVTVEVPPVEVTVEAPEVTVEAPMVTVPAPVITVEAPAAADITVEVPPAEAAPTPGYIWSIIAIGAVLVIAVIILIVRTRRVA